MNKMIGILLALTVVMINPVIAAEVLSSCKNLDTATQSQMNQCACDTYDAKEKEMKKVYAKLLKTYEDDPLRHKNIAIWQDEWIKSRELHTNAYFPKPTDPKDNNEYGSIHPVELCSLLTELTSQRIAHLQNLIDSKNILTVVK